MFVPEVVHLQLLFYIINFFFIKLYYPAEDSLFVTNSTLLNAGLKFIIFIMLM